MLGTLIYYEDVHGLPTASPTSEPRYEIRVPLAMALAPELKKVLTKAGLVPRPHVQDYIDSLAGQDEPAQAVDNSRAQQANLDALPPLQQYQFWYRALDSAPEADKSGVLSRIARLREQLEQDGYRFDAPERPTLPKKPDPKEKPRTGRDLRARVNARPGPRRRKH